MSALPPRRRVRLRRAVAATAAAGLTAAGLSMVSAAPAQADAAPQLVGTADWGLSTYLNSANMGRPNPYAAGYVAPASFDDTSKISTWGTPTGSIDPDGSAELSFKGTSVNFAKTSGAWLKLSDLAADLDEEGNGTVTAVVSYGVSAVGAPGNLTYDDSAPARPAARVDMVDLVGNSAADVATVGATTTWADLDGAWAPEFLDFLDGDSTAVPVVPGFVYASQISGNSDRTPLPFTFSVTEKPTVEVSTTATTAGATVQVNGSGFVAPVPGPDGIYVVLAKAGGKPGGGSAAEGIANSIAAAWIANAPSPGATGYLEGGVFATALTAPTAKLDPREKYSVYTFQAHSSATDAYDTETPVSIDWAELGYPLASTAGVKVTKKPTTKKKGSIRISVASSRFTPTGQVKVVYNGGKLKGKKVKVKKNVTLNAQGVATVKLPKSAKGKRTVKVTYLGSSLHKASAVVKKTVNIKK